MWYYFLEASLSFLAGGGIGYRLGWWRGYKRHEPPF